MGSSLLKGLILANAINDYNITVADPYVAEIPGFDKLDIKFTTDNKEATAGADLIVVAVKPWIVSQVVKEISSIVPENSQWAFILAGKSSEELLATFDRKPSSIAIMMPNTAMGVGRSMTFMVPVFGENQQGIKELFYKVGKVLEIEERQLPGAMALASCGLAFAMRYMRAASEGGVELGFKADKALEIVCETIKGATALIEHSPGTHPEVEIDKVTTPGGFTIKGLNAMEKFGFTTSVIEGLKACQP